MKAPDPTHWTLNSRFCAFRTIWVHLGLFGCRTTLSAKRVKLVQNFMPRRLVGILATNTPDPPQWTLNSCFGLFSTIWVHLGLFGCLTKHGAKRDRTGEKVHATKSHRNFSQLKHPIRPIGPQTHILVRFVLFGCILDPLVALQHSVQNGSNWCKSSCHKVALEFFTMNATDPPHWTLNSSFRAFCTIWVHLGLFGCLPILCAKRVKLVQKFVPRSRVGIFRNERTRSTPLDPKLMFWCVSY